MKTIVKKFELQIDEKPNGKIVIRLNDGGCVLRICNVPKELVYIEGELRDFIDITYQK